MENAGIEDELIHNTEELKEMILSNLRKRGEKEVLSQDEVNALLDIGDDIIEEDEELTIPEPESQPTVTRRVSPEIIEPVTERYELNIVQINKLKNILSKISPTKVVFEPDNKITIEMTL